MPCIRFYKEKLFSNGIPIASIRIKVAAYHYGAAILECMAVTGLFRQGILCPNRP